jgi:DMSO reductase family type II enzyme heme b subunit
VRVKTIRIVLVAGLVLWLMSVPVSAQEEKGKILYEQWCAQCHGLKGAGDGEAAERMYPRPRDFTFGVYKFRSTPSGSPPADEDLSRSIRQGMPGTAMPGWDRFTDEEVRALVRYIKGFAPEVFEAKEEQIPAGKPPKPSAEVLEQGKKVYEKAKCWECHGQQGRGDGEKGRKADFKDDWGQPAVPRNQTHPWEYRNGSVLEEIYRTITTGLSGTPMASYQDSYSDEDRWVLAAYVRSLHRERKLGISLRVIRAEKLPERPDDPAWEKAPPLDVPLGGQIIVEPRHYAPRVHNAVVRALYTDTEFALLLEWSDTKPNRGGDGKPPDAAGIQFPLKPSGGVVKPYFGMGDRKNPVVMWFWKADTAKVVELTAKGPKKDLMTERADAEVTAVAEYKDGLYRVLFKRKLQTREGSGPGFVAGHFLPFALTVYDGENGEEKGKKAVSAWYYLFLEPPLPLRVYLVPPAAGVAALLALFALARAARRRG